MEATLLYLLKANVVLALFAAAYYGLLRRLTFFGLNRVYLLVALVFAAVYPALPIPGLLPAEAPALTSLPDAWVLAHSSTVDLSAATQPAVSELDWAATGLLVYAVGVGLLLARLLVQLVALVRLRRATRPATTPAGVPYQQLPTSGDPFSFGHTIYLHAAQYSAAELAVVVAHEQAHIRQHHTVDVLLAHLGTALFWVNPAVWLLRRALLDNLEYLADAATLRTGLDRRTYQYCLLQLSRGPVGPALALPFSFLTLKNRVAMMNTPLSPNGQLARYFLAGPLVVLAALGYSAAHARSAEPEAADTASLANAAASAPNMPVEAAGSATNLLNVATEKTATSPQKPVFTLPLAARTYLANAYPQANITELVVGSFTPAGPTAYVATVRQHQQTLNLSFDAAGRFTGEKKRYKLYKPVGSSTSSSSSAKLVSARPATNQPALAKAVQSLVPPLYYFDGQVITEAQYKVLKPAAIASINILKDEQARQLAGDKGSGGVVVITSKANRDTWAVLKFNRRVERIAPPSVTDTATTRKHLPSDALYYLDGQPSTQQAVEQVEVKNLADMNILTEQASIHRLPGAANSLVPVAILVTTKANVDAPAVQAVANEADLASAYFFRPVSPSVLRPAALAYITSHYPDARITGVTEQKRKNTGVVLYQVWLANGKRPFGVYFTPQGEFAGEVKNSHL
jgi:hypothetical protein